MIAGIKARNKNNLFWGIKQQPGAGIRQKILIVRVCPLEAALGSCRFVLHSVKIPEPLPV